MSDEHTAKFVCVLKTGKLLEHDLASNALTEHGIPFHKQIETSSGLRLAMPFQPSMGPGTWFNILVHPELESDAKAVLSELPIDVSDDPDVWHFGPSGRAKRVWRSIIWIFLLIGFSFLVLNLVQNFQ